VSRATAPLWLEFPTRALGPSSSGNTRRLAKELLLDERIEALRELAGVAGSRHHGDNPGRPGREVHDGDDR
jgi:hypothetical protein